MEAELLRSHCYTQKRKKSLVSSKLTFSKILKTHKVALNKTYNFYFINFFKFAL